MRKLKEIFGKPKVKPSKHVGYYCPCCYSLKTQKLLFSYNKRAEKRKQKREIRKEVEDD